MQPLNKLKTKHDHTLTDWLKFGIFSIMMMAPFAAIASKIIYVACNKNAYQSYYGKTINEEIKTYINVNELQNGKTYNFQNYTITTPEGQLQNQFTYIYMLDVEDKNGNINNTENINYMVFFYSTQSNYINRIYYKDQTSQDINLNNTTLNFTFTIRNIQNTNVNPFLTENNFFYQSTYNKYSFIDNVFYYAVDQLSNESLFNWTQDTAIYSTINAMCEGLTIQNGALPLLLTYWTFITLIYIVFDLIIGIFTKLTHLLK